MVLRVKTYKEAAVDRPGIAPGWRHFGKVLTPEQYFVILMSKQDGVSIGQDADDFILKEDLLDLSDFSITEIVLLLLELRGEADECKRS